MKAYIFPGQGSQRKGMGSELFSKYSDYVGKANEILGYSIEELCIRDTKHQLNFTAFTQPAIYIVSVLTYLELLETKAKPDYLAGHSIGEYAALFAAGVFDFETGLKIVQRRAELMSQAKGGGLAAVLGLTESDINSLINESPLLGVGIANINSPSQIVIGAGSATLNKFILSCEGSQGRFIPLKVSGAFHTVHMRSAQVAFRSFLKTINFNAPTIPVISNYSATQYSGDEFVNNLSLHLSNSVRWTECIESLLFSGVDDFIEVGSNILMPMVNDIRQAFNVEKYSKSHNRNVSDKAIDQQETITNKSTFASHFGYESNLVIGGAGYGGNGVELVNNLLNEGLLTFLETDGLSLSDVESSIDKLNKLKNLSEKFGVSVYYDPENPLAYEKILLICSNKKVRFIELRGFLSSTDSIIDYRQKGGVCNLGKPRNRVLLRTQGVDVVNDFLINTLIDGNEVPLIDAICMDKYRFQSMEHDFYSDFENIKIACDEFIKSSPLFEKIFVGINGFPENQNDEYDSHTHQFDFIHSASLFLLSKESKINQELKIKLAQAAPHQFRDVSDWHYPESSVSTHSIVLDQTLYNKIERINYQYKHNQITVSQLRKQEKNYRLFNDLLLDQCEGMNAFELRRFVRRKIINDITNSIIKFDTYIPNYINAKNSMHPIEAVKLANLIVKNNKLLNSSNRG